MQYSRKVTNKASVTDTEDDKNATKSSSRVNLVEAVAVPVDSVPTLDSSLRNAAGSVEINVNKNVSKDEKVERLPWTFTPDPNPRNLLSHYKKLSKFRLTCTFHIP